MNKRDKERELIEALLKSYAESFYARSVISPLIATRAFGSEHLYEDMGFKSRMDFNAYMSELYPKLAEKRPKDKRWKKFLFDCIDSIAPACANCSENESCFSCEKVGEMSWT